MGRGALPPPLTGGDFGDSEEVFSGHILKEKFMEGLRVGCSSCRANGPAARAMGMARCFPAELHCDSEGTGPGRRKGLLTARAAGAEGGKAEPRLALCQRTGLQAAGQGNRLEPCPKSDPLGAAPPPLDLEFQSLRSRVGLLWSSSRWGPPVPSEAVTWAHGHSDVSLASKLTPAQPAFLWLRGFPLLH